MSLVEATMAADAAEELRNPEPAPAFGFQTSLKIVTDPGSAEAESFRSIRAHLLTQHFGHGRRGLAVVAADAESNTAFISASLAISLAEVGVSTVLIEANLTRPNLDEIIRPPETPVGIAGRLGTDAPFDSYVDGRPMRNLSVMYAGDVDEMSVELLAGARFRELVGFCLRNFDATIIDTAPANISHGAVQASVVVGYSLVVARKDETFMRDVKTLAGELSVDGVRIVGNILCGA